MNHARMSIAGITAIAGLLGGCASDSNLLAVDRTGDETTFARVTDAPTTPAGHFIGAGDCLGSQVLAVYIAKMEEANQYDQFASSEMIDESALNAYVVWANEQEANEGLAAFVLLEDTPVIAEVPTQ